MPGGAPFQFDRYLKLLRGFCPAVTDLLVFDDYGKPIWQEVGAGLDPGRVQLQLKQLQPPAQQDAQAGESTSFKHAQGLEICNLYNAQGRLLLTLCVALADTETAAESVLSKPTIEILNQSLKIEYQQSLALADKEEELNHMTDELTKRYEELNLIYKAEDQAVNIYHGRELLRQLVLNTSRFLNVDIIYLYIAGKNIAIHKYKNDNPLFETNRLFAYLRESLYPVLEKTNQSLVVNQPSDADKFEISVDTPYKHIASPLVNAENQVIGLLAIASQSFSIDFSNSDRNLLDVMTKKASKIAQSHFDPLTGLENANSFELIIKDLLKQSRGMETQHAIANVDIDRMAVINSVSGRDAGDQLIKLVGKTLAEMVRSRDVVARIGSDKFGVLLENCDLLTAKTIMRKIADEISQLELRCEDNAYEVSISAGIAPITAQAESVTSLLTAAETARNVSKQRGRNNVHVFAIDDTDLAQRKDQIGWVGRIQAALRDDRLTLYAQLIEPLKPAVDQPHYEILLRMLDDEDNIIPPGHFLPAAENFYLMPSIDYWVIDKAFGALADFAGSNRGAACPVSINLSGQSLSDPGALAAYIGEKLRHHRLDGQMICFEITESAAIANIDEARTFIDEVRAFGCRFSLDDFGTGLSSFAYLKNLKVDYLKIDGSFVTDIDRDPVSATMVASINQVGQAMQLKTVAEFVENDQIRKKLVEIGVDYGQGYELGKPAPLDALFADLAEAASKTA